MRAVCVLIFAIACERPPVMENNPDVLWFRARGVVPPATAEQIVKEAAARRDVWAGPMYVMSPSAFRGRHLLGHQRLFLREYEPASGRFRAVNAADDRIMAC